MKLMPVGDYYVWYCDWCDSKNLTLWTHFEKGQVVCGACHNHYPTVVMDSPAAPENLLSRII